MAAIKGDVDAREVVALLGDDREAIEIVAAVVDAIARRSRKKSTRPR